MSKELKKPVVPPAVSPAPEVSKQVVAEKPVAEKPVVADAVAQRKLESRCVICGKPVMKPNSDGVGSTCEAHVGKIRLHADSANTPPEGWVRMSKLCRAGEALGLSTSSIVNACGGDAATKPILHPVFRVVYVGRGKWVSPEALTVGLSLLLGKEPMPAETAVTEVAAQEEISAIEDALG